jgi:hypothetical protein
VEDKKTFSDKQTLKELMTTKSALQKILTNRRFDKTSA